MFTLSKRTFAGHGPVPPKEDLPPAPPVKPENIGKTGYGELRGELTSMYGDAIESVTDFPSDFSKLDKGMWFNYNKSDKIPPLITKNASENRRIWQELEVERMLDHHPPHEVHASELPDYHYWPSIQNEINAKPTSKLTQSWLQISDQTDIPRFGRTGIPKTPKQETDWYVPLKNDGRFDWQENIRKNGYNASLFSKQGWNKRFFVPVFQPTLPFQLTFGRSMADHPHILRSNELPFYRRVMRQAVGSNFDRHLVLALFYCGGLLYASKNAGHWNQLVWDCEIYNYDVAFTLNNRTKGGFHGIV